MNNIFHVHGEQKTTQPATEQRYRLVNYTKNAAENWPFTLKIYQIFSNTKIRNRIKKK